MIKQDTHNSVLIKAQEVAKRLATTPKHVYEMAKMGRLAHVRDGFMVRFHPADIDRWIEDHTIPAAA